MENWAPIPCSPLPGDGIKDSASTLPRNNVWRRSEICPHSPRGTNEGIDPNPAKFPIDPSFLSVWTTKLGLYIISFVPKHLTFPPFISRFNYVLVLLVERMHD
jgi:hypothetical protein